MEAAGKGFIHRVTAPSCLAYYAPLLIHSLVLLQLDTWAAAAAATTALGAVGSASGRGGGGGEGEGD